MEKAYAAWRAFQEKVLAHATAILLLGCTLLALLEVVRRYVFGHSFEWQQDAVTFITMSAVFLYFGNAQRRGSHLNVTLLTDTLHALGPGPKKAAAAIRFLATCLAFAFMVAVLWWGWIEVEDALKYASRTESLAFPMWPFLAALYVGFIFMAITLFFQIYRGFQELRGLTVLVDPPEAEESIH
ncbi:MAG: TRAP transporter small permease [Burkholderiales bacterium]